MYLFNTHLSFYKNIQKNYRTFFFVVKWDKSLLTKVRWF
ncbi:hypothetical protein BV134_1534 [Haemophilus influenzae]|nr:hypothetical protein BV131_1594 [Haemophilus influenzae]AVJ05559.1 hypothetical protein BV134_1534 [Haemophilus influenzae]